MTNTNNMTELLEKPFTVGYLREHGILVEMNIRFFNPIGLRATIVHEGELKTQEDLDKLDKNETVMVQITRARIDDYYAFHPEYLESDKYKAKQDSFNRYADGYKVHMESLIERGVKP